MQYILVNDVSELETASFYWSFVVFVMTILLNMVLAIVFNVYDSQLEIMAEAKKKEIGIDKKND